MCVDHSLAESTIDIKCLVESIGCEGSAHTATQPTGSNRGVNSSEIRYKMSVEFHRSHPQVTRSPSTVASTHMVCLQAESPLIAKAMWTHCTSVRTNWRGEGMSGTMVGGVTKKQHPRSEDEALSKSESNPKRSNQPL